ncbi:hypothetical protein SAMN04489722_11915 [Algibacter lectus]|uniref:helix-turn-helix domain-containing protein n=1 Tax=Algibacter lectus TaxID=221126 RepID=UPI0008E32F30|nr:helix-turn-helix domain-containing protein [Algibacter lectus]SFD72873.1 hypothetical protein SAMN04489722_11915 [Algibacter lectus]
MQTSIQLQLPDSLSVKLDSLLQEVKDLKNNFQQPAVTKYLTRHQVAEMLSVDISTVHNMTVKGILTKYQISGRVLYKLQEIEASIIKLNK